MYDNKCKKEIAYEKTEENYFICSDGNQCT